MSVSVDLPNQVVIYQGEFNTVLGMIGVLLLIKTCVAMTLELLQISISDAIFGA